MPLYLVEVAVFGGILALAVLAFRRVPIPPTWTSRDWLRRLHGRAQGVPYGIAIGAAGLLAFQHLGLH